MDQRKLSVWLKWMIAGVGVCGAVVYFAVLPVLMDNLLYTYPEFAVRRWPWLIFLWTTGIPCYAVLVQAWGVAARIGRDESFCAQNAVALKRISYLAAGDTAYFFLGQIVLFLLNMSHPGVLLSGLLVVFAGVAVTVAAAALSHLIYKAAAMREENDLTI